MLPYSFVIYKQWQPNKIAYNNNPLLALTATDLKSFAELFATSRTVGIGDEDGG